MKYRYVPRVNRKYVGSYLPKIDGKEKAMGRTKFFDDITIKAKVPRMLHMAILNAPHANGNIRSMDTAEADALEGVRGILRYDAGVDANQFLPVSVQQVIRFFEKERIS